jgi:hypothetical protein
LILEYRPSSRGEFLLAPIHPPPAAFFGPSDTDSQLADIFIKPLDSSRFASLWGEIGICHPYGLVCRKVGALSCIFEPFTFLLHFLHTHLNHFASAVILACICLIMLITMLG